MLEALKTTLDSLGSDSGQPSTSLPQVGLNDVSEFLDAPGPILDVRSPGEFALGHIPGAINLPLFTDSERAEVGILYKSQGRLAAIERGLELVGPKMAEMSRLAGREAESGHVRLHCWRGGMRSGSVAWLLRTVGLRVTLLPGGYKRYRRWVSESFALRKNLVVLGGRTGVGKTDLLHELRRSGASILDLEGIANHRGSSFGALGLEAQPSQQQFENELAGAWRQLSASAPTWIESESQYVGKRLLPSALFQQMLVAPWVIIHRSVSERCQILAAEYGPYPPADLIEATQRIERRLGGQHCQQAIEWIRAGQLTAACERILTYYDKLYDRHLAQLQPPTAELDLTGVSVPVGARRLLELTEAR